MSNSFRPYREQWGQHSSSFMPTGQVYEVFSELAQRAGASLEDSWDHGDCLGIKIQRASALLDYLDQMDPAQELVALRTTNSFDDVENGDLEALLGNMKSYAADWYSMIDNDDDTICFLID